MFTILGGILATIFDSISVANWKKSLNESTLSKGMFKIFGQMFGFFWILGIVFLIGIDTQIFGNILDILLIFLIVGIGSINIYLNLYILKNTKLSILLPYENLDKLFIVIIGFFLFFGTDKGVSIYTLLITILTIALLVIFNIDFKKVKLPKEILLYILYKGIKATQILILSFILVKYSSIIFVAFNWLFEVIIFISIALIIKDSFKSLTKQSKQFYISRIITTFTGRSGWLIGLYIIETAGVIIATLLGFFSVVFNTISMKIFLNDNPSKKQMILAFMVIVLIGIGYYFK